jgi:hypothetical protein
LGVPFEELAVAEADFVAEQQEATGKRLPQQGHSKADEKNGPLLPRRNRLCAGHDKAPMRQSSSAIAKAATARPRASMNNSGPSGRSNFTAAEQPGEEPGAALGFTLGAPLGVGHPGALRRARFAHPAGLDQRPFRLAVAGFVSVEGHVSSCWW